MPSTYSPELRIQLIANGEQSGYWGTTTNVNLGTIIEQAIAGAQTVSITSAAQALVASDGIADQARNAVVTLTTTTTANFAVYIPPTSKLYVVRNSTAYIATVYCSTVRGNTTAAGAGIAIPAGKTAMVWTDGINVAEQLNAIIGSLSVGGDLTVGGNVTTSGAVVIDDALSVGASLSVGGDISLYGGLSASEPITAYSSIYLDGVTPQTVSQASAIDTINETIALASAVFSNGTAVMLTSSDTMPTGLSTDTLYYTVATNITGNFSGTGGISGTVLTITSVNSGAIGVGTVISGTGVTAATTVTSLGTGVGNIGTYNVNNSQTVASTTISGTYAGAQKIKLSTSFSGSPVNISAVGTGDLTITPVALANTPPIGSSTNAVATANFVVNAIPDNKILANVNAATTSNITLSGTQTIDDVALVAGNRVLVKNQITSTQTPTFYAASLQSAAFTVASPTVVTVATAPNSGTPVTFTTTEFLPTGVLPNTTYYVNKLSSTTFQISTSPTLSPTVNVTAAGSGTQTMVVNQSVITVPSAPAANSQVMFTTTGSLLTGLSTTQVYFVVNRTATTFSVSLYANGPAIALSGTSSGTNLVGVNSSADNGVYKVSAGTWSRATDANTASKIAAAQVVVTAGTLNGGTQYATNFKSTDTLDSTVMAWNKVVVTPLTVVPSNQIENASITPEKLSGAQAGAAPIYGVRAWASFKYTTTTVINGQGNIASITRSAVGRYTVTFTTAMPDANYSVTAAAYASTVVSSSSGRVFGVFAKTASGFSVAITDSSNNNYADPADCGFHVIC